MPQRELQVLTALGRMRRVETDEARRHLGEALAQETALEARDAAIGRELDAAMRLTGDFDRQAFFAWLGRKRGERAEVSTAMRAAEARTAAARSVLAHRRVAETAAEEALARTAAAREADVARRDQVMLEDVARALRRTNGTARE
jgi:hypothetical protein